MMDLTTLKEKKFDHINSSLSLDWVMYSHITMSKTRDVLPIDSTSFFYANSKVLVPNHGMT